MKKLSILAILILLPVLGWAVDKVEITVNEYTIKNDTPPIDNKKYTADIYIGGNLLVSGIEVKSKETSKAECEEWLKKYNQQNGTNKSESVGNVTIKVSE